MNTKHTPGPWSINKYDAYDKEIFICEPGVSVDFDDVPREEQEANARLIAATPDLLEALKETLAEMESLMKAREIIYQGGINISNRARAAIAKATGEQP